MRHNHLDKFKKINNNYQTKVVTHQDKEYLVIPVVMMREGVHAGSIGPLYHSIEELGRFPASWNGIPIVVNHPKDSDGNDVSANNPDIIENDVIGRVYNTNVEGSKLKAEAWLDKEKLIGNSALTYQYVENQSPLNVSVGVFTDQEEITGDWNGENYEAIARNHRPDHLALLPESVGACSVEDGCALGFNKQKEGGINVKRQRKNPATYAVNSEARISNYDGTTNSDWLAPSFSQCVDGYYNNHDEQRPNEGISSVEDAPQSVKNWIASLSLLGNNDAESFQELLYFPVVEPSSMNLSESALRAVIGGRGSQADISNSARRSARKKAYNLLNKEFDANLKISESLEAVKQFNTNGFIVRPIVNEQGYYELMQKVSRKLDSMDHNGVMHFPEEIYDNSLIYCTTEQDGGPTYYRVNYSVNNDGTVEFTGEPTKVRRNVEYVNLNTMSKNEKVEQLVNNKETKFTDEDKKWLENLEEGQLDKFLPNSDEPCCPEKVDTLINNESTKFTENDRDWLLTQNAETLEKLVPKQETKPQNNQEGVDIEKTVKEVFSKYEKPEEAIDNLFPGELAEQLKSGLTLHRNHRSELISQITTNSKNFTEDELKNMDNVMLEKITNSVTPQTNYAAFGSNGGSTETVKEGVYPIEVLEAMENKNKQ